jgi:hypothetical protein
MSFSLAGSKALNLTFGIGVTSKAIYLYGKVLFAGITIKLIPKKTSRK